MASASLLEKGQINLRHRDSAYRRSQGDFSPAEVKLLRQLYPQILAALGQVELLERERSVRADLEEFLRRLPLPTIILRWNLKPIYQNNAAREFCAVWQKGPDEAKRTKANSSIPPEILNRCRVLKEKWRNAQPQMRAIRRTDFKEEKVNPPPPPLPPPLLPPPPSPPPTSFPSPPSPAHPPTRRRASVAAHFSVFP